jgi:flagellar hook protein FlgE
MSTVTGFEGDTTIRNQELDGAPSAGFEKYQIEANGNIVSYYKDGRSRPVGQIALAAVDNPDGMQIDGSYFSLTTNSGKMRVGVAGQAGFGNVTPGVIEGSNVNTTDELVSLISSQRFFQANAKVIGASKELNSSLMQNV